MEGKSENKDHEEIKLWKTFRIMEKEQIHTTKKWNDGKAKEQMTECTKSHFTLTKYVTLENMANSPIQNIKCFPNK